MLKEHSTIIRRTVIIADAALLAIAFFLAFAIRFQRLPETRTELWNYGWVTLPFSAVFIFNLYRSQLYHKLRYLSYLQILRHLAFAFLAATMVAAAALFLSHATGYSRLLFIYFAILSALFMLIAKLGGKYFLNQLRSRGFNFRSVLLVGRGKKLEELKRIFRPGNPYGVKIVDSVEINQETPQHFARRLTDDIIDDVYFAIPREDNNPTTIDSFLKLTEAAGKTSKIILNINENRLSKCEFSRLENFPLVVLHPVVLDPDQIFIKRMMDIIGALTGLAINLVLFPFIAIAIKLDSPGPIFFSQVRIGQNGRHFRLYKYRSMFKDAEQKKSELQYENEMKGPVFKLSNDPRITRVGRFLRKTSLDEMPQFWNVLIGEMSLVGTRPPTPDEVSRYGLHHYRRLSIKPGITGLWQVSGRNRVSDFDEIVKLDTRYIDQWSLWLDCRILVKTIFILLSGK
ncbi:MAG: sugar transferase [Deltaproteobacteria bacterium]|nr:sugar transferase [Deltaproteobacteria bacterium]